MVKKPRSVRVDMLQMSKWIPLSSCVAAAAVVVVVESGGGGGEEGEEDACSDKVEEEDDDEDKDEGVMDPGKRVIGEEDMVAKDSSPSGVSVVGGAVGITGEVRLSRSVWERGNDHWEG